MATLPKEEEEEEESRFCLQLYCPTWNFAMGNPGHFPMRKPSRVRSVRSFEIVFITRRTRFIFGCKLRIRRALEWHAPTFIKEHTMAFILSVLVLSGRDYGKLREVDFHSIYIPHWRWRCPPASSSSLCFDLVSCSKHKPRSSLCVIIKYTWSIFVSDCPSEQREILICARQPHQVDKPIHPRYSCADLHCIDRHTGGCVFLSSK